MRIYPAVHYTMGGLWVDYNLMSNVPGLFVLGEANFSDHGANRLGASALMQGLADGYFVLPYTIGDYLAPLLGEAGRPDRRPRVQGRASATVDDAGRASCCRSTATAPSTTSTASSARSIWDNCGMARTEQSLEKALSEIPAIREEFWKNVRVLGDERDAQPVAREGRPRRRLPRVRRAAWCRDALHRKESCGGHFREEYQTEEGEALRDDEHFAYVAAWEFTGVGERARAAQGAARVRGRPPGDPLVQVSDRETIDARQTMHITLTVWRQAGPDTPGAFETYDVPGMSPDMSFLEMLDMVNERLSSTARSRSRSTTTAARASAARAG